MLVSLQAALYPPLVVFPEGKLVPGDAMLPFRHGVFALACENRIAFLPCALRYRPAGLTPWAHGEGIGVVVWHLAQASQPLRAEVLPLATVQPQPEDDPAHSLGAFPFSSSRLGWALCGFRWRR